MQLPRAETNYPTSALGGDMGGVDTITAGPRCVLCTESGTRRFRACPRGRWRPLEAFLATGPSAWPTRRLTAFPRGPSRPRATIDHRGKGGGAGTIFLPGSGTIFVPFLVPHHCCGRATTDHRGKGGVRTVPWVCRGSMAIRLRFWACPRGPLGAPGSLPGLLAAGPPAWPPLEACRLRR